MQERKTLLESLPDFQQKLKSHPEAMVEIAGKAYSINPWFTEEFVRLAMDAIAEKFLDKEACERWLQSYPPLNDNAKSIAIVMAGNLPLVGFHDLFCVLMSGHRAIVKPSDKDAVLLPWLVHQWSSVVPSLKDRIQFVEKLEQFDAVIATGSNNSSRYFDYYFRKYPHILRRNRNGVAVLTGNESVDDLKLLAKDFFLYFGLGCRNVSRVYVPVGYDFNQWEEAVADWAYLADHHKYRNNLEYNYALYIINNLPHRNLGSIILKEDEAIASRIGTLHYSHYSSLAELTNDLQQHRDEIQCVVSSTPLEGWEHIAFGESQQPLLHQYADGVDTMAFLSTL